MANGVQFERGTNAPDGIHEIVEFSEFHNAKWWTEKAIRKNLLDRLMPFAIVAGALLCYCIVGMMECAL